MNPEGKRLEEDRQKTKHWKRWGPYVSARQWGTVREDYSEEGEAWHSFPFDQARSRAYRWGEDGIFGISDNHQRLCFAFSFWNGEDSLLKERFFGLSGKEGNHGEDLKECYFNLDNTPTHSYMKALYKYPHRAFPYEKLREVNKNRTNREREYELVETGIFDENRYFDLQVEYAKASPDDILICLTATNRGKEARKLHLLPTLWFRNTWGWGKKGNKPKPEIKTKMGYLEAEHYELGRYFLYFEDNPELLFTENETNQMRLFGVPNPTPFVKDAFHDYLIQGTRGAVNPHLTGTKAALHYQVEIAPEQSFTLRLRLSNTENLPTPFQEFSAIFSKCKEEADYFYQEMTPEHLGGDLRKIQRQAFAGLLWNKQFYHYVVEEWLKGDAKKLSRRDRRNANWNHLYNDDILSVPDKWEYPCFFSWDSAFQIIPLAIIDSEFAKKQLTLLTREWYMHPNGKIPAHEWSFDDVNPPVYAWAAWRVYKIEKKYRGKGDRHFLEGVFQKLLLNFTWWVNRKDAQGKNVFHGGFLGLDNISVFNRSELLPAGFELYQSDATSWMGMYCLNMLTIALELAQENPVYEDMASKFYEHFLYIAHAINFSYEKSFSLWNEEDGFYYDFVQKQDGTYFPLKIRSLVGLIPLFAVSTLSPDMLERFVGFRKRMDWFLENRTDLCEQIASLRVTGVAQRRILSIINPERLRRVLSKMLDEREFLSPHGIRSLSKYHEEHPYTLQLDSREYRVGYEPADAIEKMYGGNSNWRGPIWFPLNMLIIESLQKFHYYFGDDFKVECPTGSGKKMTLWEVSTELSKRLVSLFTQNEKGERPVYGNSPLYQHDPHWKDYILFYEYFHGDEGAGLGASHQTGWTGLVAKLIQQTGQYSSL